MPKKETPTDRSKRVAYITAHPEMTATGIYKKWKGTKLGIRKSKALELVRKTRGRKPKAPISKRKEAYTPKKYRRKKPAITRVRPEPVHHPPASSYVVAEAEAIDRNGETVLLHLKYTKYTKQQVLEKLGQYYKILSLEVIKEVPYTEFIAEGYETEFFI